MLDFILAVAGASVFFVGGVLVGHNNVKTVDKAIADLKLFEARAKVTLDKITQHKAS